MTKPTKEAQPPQWACRLAHLRKMNSLSQAKFGASIGVSKEAYQLYEKGAREPRFATLIKLATIYEISLDLLIRGRQPTQVSGVPKEFDFAAAPETEKRRYLEGVLEATVHPPIAAAPRTLEKAPPRVQSPARPKRQ